MYKYAIYATGDVWLGDVLADSEMEALAQNPSAVIAVLISENNPLDRG